MGASDYLTKLSQHSGQVGTGARLIVVMGAALIGLSIVINPVLKQVSERMATGYVVARSIEGMIMASALTRAFVAGKGLRG